MFLVMVSFVSCHHGEPSIDKPYAPVHPDIEATEKVPDFSAKCLELLNLQSRPTKILG